MPNKPQIKVIIDTNLWISFLIGKQLANLKTLLIEETIKPIFSQQLLDEINLVTQRPKLQKYFPPEKVKELLNQESHLLQQWECQCDLNWSFGTEHPALRCFLPPALVERTRKSLVTTE